MIKRKDILSFADNIMCVGNLSENTINKLGLNPKETRLDIEYSFNFKENRGTISIPDSKYEDLHYILFDYFVLINDGKRFYCQINYIVDNQNKKVESADSSKNEFASKYILMVILNDIINNE